MSKEVEKFIQASEEYIKELEKKARDSEYFRGRVDGLEYVLDTFENVFKKVTDNEIF